MIGNTFSEGGEVEEEGKKTGTRKGKLPIYPLGNLSYEKQLNYELKNRCFQNFEGGKES